MERQANILFDVTMALNILVICSQAGLNFIQLGKPQKNAYVERFNRTLRYDWLNQYIFETIEDVQHAAIEWLWVYNNERPNMAIGGITPKQKLAMKMPMDFSLKESKKN